MVQMTNEQWELVLKKHQQRLDEIKDLQLDLKETKEVKEFFKINHAKDGNALQRKQQKIDKLYMKNARLQKEINETNASLSLVLETLNDALKTMEIHGLKSKVLTVNASALDLLV